MCTVTRVAHLRNICNCCQLSGDVAAVLGAVVVVVVAGAGTGAAVRWLVVAACVGTVGEAGPDLSPPVRCAPGLPL